MVRNKTCRHSLPPPPANVHIATELLPLKVWKRPYCRAMRKTWRCYDLSRSQWRQEVPDCRLYRTNEGFPDNHFWNCRCRKDFVRTVLSTIDALIGTVISDQICIHNKSLPTKAELVLFSDDVIRLTSAGFWRTMNTSCSGWYLGATQREPAGWGVGTGRLQRQALPLYHLRLRQQSVTACFPLTHPSPPTPSLILEVRVAGLR